MTETPPFLDEPDGTREAIMRATYLALCEHGYAGLTVQRIGEEFEKSKSLLYHHYDDKDELLLAFLSFMLERFQETVPDPVDESPRARLDALLDATLAPTLDETHREFTAAMVELRAQAAHDERYREEFAEHDRVVRERLVDLLREGAEEGVFRNIDADRAASALLTAFVGTSTRRVTGGGDDAAAAARAEADAYVEGVLLTEAGQ